MESRHGTLTFLFTDIEGSTRLWERRPEAMSSALARHDEIVRSAVQRHDGEVFKTWGDAFCAVFPTADAGTAAAVDLQSEISREPWVGAPVVVRCALHAGTAEHRDGDYFGATLNRVARLLSAAHGGQTLLSETAAELARDSLPAGSALRDLGPHRLRDLEREEHVYQLVRPGLRSEFPPIRALRARHDNLPSQTASFIGREEECAELARLLSQPDVRLVTLTGAGGCGKTRLALQLCSNCIEEFADGACFVQLDAITDRELVGSAIAQALHLREGGERPIWEVLHAYVRDKSLLLALDNFEQVMDAATSVAGLINSSTIKVLVTSREPLHLYGEREYPVPSLDVPKSTDARDVSSSSASRLFVERAQAADPRFELTAGNASSIAEICKRLDGLPLAIELAAARVRLLSPQAMLDRLDSRLGILTGGARDLPERQRTMRGAIDWSYALLSESECALFRWLGVFSGGFTLDAAEEVCGFDVDHDVLSGLSSLLNKSLVRRDAAAEGAPRFVMLGTIREYALERLELSGELPSLRERHAAWALRLAELVGAEMHGPRQLASLARCEDDHDNFRAALAWFAERDGIEVLQLAEALAPFWRLHSHLSEGRQWLAHGLALAGPSSGPALRCRALLWNGQLTGDAGDYGRAEELFTQAADLAITADDAALRGRICAELAWMSIVRGNISDAVAGCQEAVELLRTTTDYGGLGDALHTLGHAQGDATGLESARPAWDESLRLFRRIGDGWSQAQLLKDLGLIACRSGDHSAAAELYEESLVLLREIGDKYHLADTLMRLGELALFTGESARAVERFLEALSIARDVGNETAIIEGLMRYAEASETEGDYLAAGLLLEEALEIARRLSHERLVAAALHNLAYVALNAGDAVRAQLLLSECTAIHRSLERDVEVALDLAAFGALALVRRRYAEAARLFGASDAIVGDSGVMLRRVDRLEFVVGQQERITSLRAMLGDDAFAREWRAGRSLSQEEALALAGQLAASIGGGDART